MLGALFKLSQAKKLGILFYREEQQQAAAYYLARNEKGAFSYENSEVFPVIPGDDTFVNLFTTISFDGFTIIKLPNKRSRFISDISRADPEKVLTLSSVLPTYALRKEYRELIAKVAFTEMEWVNLFLLCQKPAIQLHDKLTEQEKLFRELFPSRYFFIPVSALEIEFAISLGAKFISGTGMCYFDMRNVEYIPVLHRWFNGHEPEVELQKKLSTWQEYVKNNTKEINDLQASFAKCYAESIITVLSQRDRI